MKLAEPLSLPRRRVMLAIPLLALPAAARSRGARAQENWPSRPIRLIVPFGPGSTGDAIARLVSGPTAGTLGRPLAVDNRPGAGGVIGAEATAHAAADGYTFGIGSAASHAVSPATTARLSYDLMGDFAAVALLVTAPSLIVVHHSVPATTLTEYLAHARRQGRSLYVSAGTGTVTHLAGELLRARQNAPLEHVPYRAVGGALADLLAGNVEMMAYQVPALLPHIGAGTLRPVATATAARLPTMPNLPTAAEQLGDPDFDFATWLGVFAPAATLRPIIDRMGAALLAALTSPELRDALPAQGFAPIGWGPERFDAFFRAEVPRWAKIVRDVGLAAR